MKKLRVVVLMGGKSPEHEISLVTGREVVRNFDKNKYEYEAKYQPGMSEEIVPARIPEKLTKEVQDLAVRVYKAIGCRGFGRVEPPEFLMPSY